MNGSGYRKTEGMADKTSRLLQVCMCTIQQLLKEGINKMVVDKDREPF